MSHIWITKYWNQAKRIESLSPTSASYKREMAFLQAQIDRLAEWQCVQLWHHVADLYPAKEAVTILALLPLDLPPSDG